MEQRSDVKFRAEKLYKFKKNKFEYLIRELLSNAIHEVIIRSNKDNNEYNPAVSMSIQEFDSEYRLQICDNGFGFNKLNRMYFTHLDTENSEKKALNFRPMGQGRLAILYFSDLAHYVSVYKDDNDEFKLKQFYYPEMKLPIFDIDDDVYENTKETESKTIVNLMIKKPENYRRAKTFFSIYNDIDNISNWVIDVFFPFIIEFEKLKIIIEMNGSVKIIDRSFLDDTVKSVSFSIKFDDNHDFNYDFKLWLVESDEISKSKNQIICFARHLRADLSEGKLEYEIDNIPTYKWFLCSSYFDEYVDMKGDKIEIDLKKIDVIQSVLKLKVDEYFSETIIKNRKESEKNIKKVADKYCSLSVFMDEISSSSTNKIIKECEVLTAAVERKGKIEKIYWSDRDAESKDVAKLLNSSLQIYIDHRGRVLDKFKTLINKFSSDGTLKSETEDEIHGLLMKRGESFHDTSDRNHLHNLWMFDDKYTIFSKTFRGVSAKNGKKCSDIYLWSDDPDNPRELLILELKSTTHAHNSGSSEESMVAQVKRYAAQCYKNPRDILNWDHDMDNFLYYGVILARKGDIYKELNSNRTGKPHKIPFLKSSYFFNEEFFVSRNSYDTPENKNIRIDMYSYEDVYDLASSRNKVFLSLLKGEYSIGDESSEL